MGEVESGLAGRAASAKPGGGGGGGKERDMGRRVGLGAALKSGTWRPDANPRGAPHNADYGLPRCGVVEIPWLFLSAGASRDNVGRGS